MNPCTKRRHPTEWQATSAMYRAWRVHRGDKLPVRVYHCPTCQGWHLTSQPLREKVAR